jgi:metal-responsive CopG/Arc/MetJ family transcriptional regulator
MKTMSSKVKNITFSLPIELIDKYKEYAQNSDIPSMNAGVKEALEEYVVKLEKEKLHCEMLKAANDPLFMKDLTDTMAAFSASDTEAAKEVHEW